MQSEMPQKHTVVIHEILPKFKEILCIFLTEKRVHAGMFTLPISAAKCEANRPNSPLCSGNFLYLESVSNRIENWENFGVCVQHYMWETLGF